MADWAAVGLDAAALIAMAAATGMKIEEAIADYTQDITDIRARSADVSAEATRQIANTRTAGIEGLREAGHQAAYEGRMAMTQAEMVSSGEEARLGASGVRAKGSPLLAAQQNVDLAFAAADRTVQAGQAGMRMGALQLKTGMQDIGAQATMVTKEYGRQIAEQTRKRKYLQENKLAMVGISLAGGIASLGSSFYTAGKNRGWL